MTFGAWKIWKRETNDDARDFSNRARRRPCGGRGHIHTQVAQEQGADPTWRGQETPPLGVRGHKEDAVSDAAHFIFGYVSRLLISVEAGSSKQ